MGIFLFVLILILDQATKRFVLLHMLPGETRPVLDGFFHMTFVCNPGAAFGLLANSRWVFIVAAVFVLGVFAVYRRRMQRESRFLYYCCTALAAGTLGNLIDRIRYGFVIDFFDFRFWPVFNIADIAIVAGIGGMLYLILFTKRAQTDDE